MRLDINKASSMPIINETREPITTDLWATRITLLIDLSVKPTQTIPICCLCAKIGRKTGSQFPKHPYGENNASYQNLIFEHQKAN